MSIQAGVLATMMVLGALPAAASDAQFAAPRDYAALSPWAVASGDFNGDGKTDLVVANFYNQSVTVKLNGGGAFVAPVGLSPESVAVADFNHDGRLDVAVIVEGTTLNSVAVLLGNGDGTLQAPRLAPVAHLLLGPLAIGDFNGDGKPDVLVTTDNALGAVLLGNGDGTLQPAMPLPSTDVAIGIAVGDFNGDGRLDIAASVNTRPTRLSVLPGRGDGTFLPPVYTPTTFLPGIGAIVAGNLNNDGKLDLAAVVGTDMDVLAGLGDGTFQVVSTVPQAGLAPAAIGDFNHDGKLDVAGFASRGFAGVLLGGGDGTLQKPSYVPTCASGNGGGLAVADWNVDGNLDLVVACANDQSLVDALSIRYGKGDGTFAGTPGLWTGTAMTTAATADFNGDGATDLVTVAYDGTSHLAIVLGNGNGTFKPSPFVVTIPLVVSGVAAADFDGDSRVDLMIAGGNPQGIYLLRGRGDGSVGAPELITTSTDTTVLAHDLNGDGMLDLVVVNPGTPPMPGIFTLLGHGDGTFGTPIEASPDTAAGEMRIADFDGDGIPDLAYTDLLANTVSVASGNGDGTFRTAVATPVPDSPRWLTAADFDGDGRMDLAVTSQSSVTANVVRVLLGNGDDSFKPPVEYVSFSSPTVVRAADLNGDGVPDLAVLNQSTLSVLVGKGDGTFRLQGTAFSAGIDAAEIAFGDFTSDGRVDLAIPGTYGVALLYNTTR